ncbi:amidohydrolase family protein [Pseudorhodoferax soli]|uniref:Putative TIM-barrel fold metal-dependent hydrolase n=1 Tax=Pseudorhodoferax soli TaxID=545864 RepID=A0A368XKX2_9BURK|nr:amidohydrolase family protein [Pseudorhodoferax soli]RCW68505.1 putative TIM-barrel fold metal-dependent hydrolase [Pseudorhodoferax soli]
MAGPQVPPPKRHPRRPRLTLPPGSCDTHVHVYGPAARFAFVPHRPYTPDDAPVERVQALHGLLGVQRAVYVQATVHGHDNAAVLDAISRAPQDHRGIALVRPDVGDAELHALHAGGVRGVRFNFIRHLNDAPDPAAVLRLAERVERLGWHLELHFSAQDLLDHLPMLHSMPCAYAIDHMGRTPVAAGLEQEACLALLGLLADARAWVKLSGPERISTHLAQGGGFPYDDAVPFARQLLQAAPHRCVWGTDWPHPNVREMPDDGDLVDLLAHYGDAAVLQRLLVDNPARLYGF